MGKKKGKAAAVPSKSSQGSYTPILVVAAIVAGMAIFFYSGRDTSRGTGQLAGTLPPEYSSTNPALRNRLILPARAHPTRPVTLPPESFSDDETRRAYQAARDYPEVLESVSCYCGCFRESAHRNNLDCFKDNHGIT